MKNTLSIDHINLSVSSFKISAKFYEHIFGFKIVELGEDGSWGVLRNGESMLCLHETGFKQEPNSKRINHFAFRVTEVDEILKKIKASGSQVRFGGEYIYPNSSSWYVFDPDGHSIEIVKWNDNKIRF